MTFPEMLKIQTVVGHKLPNLKQWIHWAFRMCSQFFFCLFNILSLQNSMLKRSNTCGLQSSVTHSLPGILWTTPIPAQYWGLRNNPHIKLSQSTKQSIPLFSAEICSKVFINWNYLRNKIAARWRQKHTGNALKNRLYLLLVFKNIFSLKTLVRKY